MLVHEGMAFLAFEFAFAFACGLSHLRTTNQPGPLLSHGCDSTLAPIVKLQFVLRLNTNFGDSKSYALVVVRDM